MFRVFEQNGMPSARCEEKTIKPLFLIKRVIAAQSSPLSLATTAMRKFQFEIDKFVLQSIKDSPTMYLCGWRPM
jgi:hypothetical protein